MTTSPINILEARALQPANGMTPFSVQLRRHSLTCIVGPGDTGKTACLRALGGVDRPLQGELQLLGENFWQMDVTARRALRQRACYVLPNTALLSSYSVLRNVMLPAQYHRAETPESIERRALDLLRWLGFTANTDLLPGFLPDLQRRLIAICRCLMLNPEMLFVDDAFAFLDPLAIQKMSRHYLDMRSELKVTLVLATHHIDFAAHYADTIIFMHPDGPRVFNSWQQVQQDQDPYIQAYIDAGLYRQPPQAARS